MNDDTTTVEKLKNTAPQLTKRMSDDMLNQLIQDARLQVLASGFPKYVLDIDGDQIPVREQATRVLALHLAQMDANPASAGVTSEQVSTLHLTFASKTTRDWLNSSTYGQEFLWLFDNYANGGRPHIMVFQH